MNKLLSVALALSFAGHLLADDGGCPVAQNIRGHENVEWSIAYAFHLTDENKGLPRVLLIGDSICSGYQERVRALTDGTCTVSYWISSYCVTSPEYRRLLSFHLDAARYDVIHFNNGLHSLQTDTAAWATALGSALRLIREKQPQARIVWTTSTPLKDAAKTAKVLELNAAAASVVRAFGKVETDDLFALLDPLDREGYWSDVYHHKPAIRELEARQVAKCICPDLALPTMENAGRPVPSPALARRLEDGPELIGIVHWGLNTYTDRDWGSGDEDPSLLNPSAFDADQIVGAAKAGGLQGLVVVAKHHDGFCLWPTKTTEHNISKSPFRGGKGDYVREMSEACRRQGLKFGVYCSPWDRNNAEYGRPKYVATYHAQLRELLDGRYGEVFEMWFDNANGGDGYYGGAREKRTIPSGYYRFGEVFRFVRELQPQVCIFNEDDGADFRWPGNEKGELGDSCRATGGHFDIARYEDYMTWANGGVTNGVTFHPPEADFPLRPEWFYHASENGRTKGAAFLMRRYLNIVGNGGTMNIGLAPDKTGRMCGEDVRALDGFGKMRRIFFGSPVTEGPCNVVVMREDVSGGEHVDEWHLELRNRPAPPIVSGTAVGVRRIRVFDRPYPAEELRVRVSGGSGRPPKMLPLAFYRVDEALVKRILAESASGETSTARKMNATRSVSRP